MNKAWAFLKRDFRIETSYRLSFLLSLASIFFATSVFYFLGKIVDPSVVGDTSQDYFSFVIIGIAFSSYLRTGLSAFSETLREEQMIGTLEAMLATPTGYTAVIIYSSLWRFVFTSVTAFLYLLMGALFFGLSLGHANIPPALLLLVLTVISYSSLGILAACFIMVFKRGDPINWVVGNLSTLLAGVYYPLTVMPGWMQGLAKLFPLTWSLQGLRLALLKGYGFGQLKTEILAMLVLCAVLVPASLFLFRLAVDHAKKVGSLIKY
jgi:ABC-2 type transport system permease protein